MKVRWQRNGYVKHLSGWKEKPRVLCERIPENPKVDFRGREDFSWDPPFNLKAAEWK